MNHGNYIMETKIWLLLEFFVSDSTESENVEWKNQIRKGNVFFFSVRWFLYYFNMQKKTT